VDTPRFQDSNKTTKNAEPMILQQFVEFHKICSNPI